MWAAFAILALFVLPPAALHAQPGPRQIETLTVLNAAVEIPQGDLRRVSLPPLQKGDTVLVEFRAERPAMQAALEILRREDAGDGKAVYRHMRQLPVSASGEIRYLVPAAGTYVLALRPAEQAGGSTRIGLHVQVRHAQAGARMQVHMLSSEKRMAVAVFSLGFLWTTLVVCGTPLIRAFRSRKRPPSPSWFA